MGSELHRKKYGLPEQLRTHISRCVNFGKINRNCPESSNLLILVKFSNTLVKVPCVFQNVFNGDTTNGQTCMSSLARSSSRPIEPLEGPGVQGPRAGSRVPGPRRASAGSQGAHGTSAPKMRKQLARFSNYWIY